MIAQLGNRSGRLLIRVMEREDINAARILHNDESTLFNLSDVEHVSEAQQEAWFTSVSTSRKSKRYSIIEAASGDFVGVFRIDMLDLINRSVCVGLDIMHEKRGKGFSKEIYKYFLEYYFLQYGIHRVYLAVLETNSVARNLYAKLGFREEGVHRDAIFRHGKYVDLIWMSLLRHEFNIQNNPDQNDK